MKIGIVGYGNLGKGVEAAIKACSDMELVGVFTRRDPASVQIRTQGVPVFSYDSMFNMKDEIDVMVLCGGSATDLPEMTPELAEHFHVVDSFDTHANIPQHFDNVDAMAKKGGNIAIISVGWDPGMFSVNRVYANAILPVGSDYTFWGTGVSQGHSDAIRRIEGVADARQYTVPVPAAVERVLAGENPELTTREKHTRECYVVAKEGADLAKIEDTIKTMPNYFADYDTTVTFISQAEMDEKHSGIPHGGNVIRSGLTGWDNETKQTIEYKLTLESNPEFTANVLIACARAGYRMASRGDVGCKTIFDIAPGDMSQTSAAELRATML